MLLYVVKKLLRTEHLSLDLNDWSFLAEINITEVKVRFFITFRITVYKFGIILLKLFIILFNLGLLYYIFVRIQSTVISKPSLTTNN